MRINTVTPITPPALITMALLWADRALTVDQLLALLERYAEYVDERGFPVTCRPIAHARHACCAALRRCSATAWSPATTTGARSCT